MTAPARTIPSATFEDLKDYIDAADRAVKQDLKVWIMGSIMSAAMLVAAPGGGGNKVPVWYNGTNWIVG